MADTTNERRQKSFSCKGKEDIFTSHIVRGDLQYVLSFVWRYIKRKGRIYIYIYIYTSHTHTEREREERRRQKEKREREREREIRERNDGTITIQNEDNNSW